MNAKIEFEAWSNATKRSQYNWTMDKISYANSGEMLFYIGGENGRFVDIQKDGLFIAGIYEGAIPHIGEAIMTAEIAQQFPTQNAAYERLVEIVGLKFLLDTMFDVCSPLEVN